MAMAEEGRNFVDANKETLDAAKEIAKIAGGANEAAGEIITETETSKLVLPSLSISDQIRELEGIRDGLGQKAFDDEQLRIIRSEISGVEQKIRTEKSQALPGLEKNLANVREKLLADITVHTAKGGDTDLVKVLTGRGVTVVNLAQWRKINEAELTADETSGRPHIKLVKTDDMLRVGGLRG